MSIRAQLAAERSDLVALLRDLSEDEWDNASLCAGWRVREVAGHLLHDTIGPLAYTAVAAKNRFGVDRLNNDLAARAGAMPTATIIDKLENRHGQYSRFIPRLILADMVVHHQDILRPLGRTREIPTDRLLTVLAHPDPLSFPKPRTRDLRFVATDIDWSSGTGPEIRGTGEALALAIGGRPIVLPELEGDGVAILRDRLAG